MGAQPSWTQSYKTVKDLDAFANQIKMMGLSLTDTQKAELDARRKELEAKEEEDDATPLYSAMKAQSKFPITEEFDGCVRRTVDKLLADGCNADKPGLLLGNIQCGKTNTFENIIALAFDKGIEVCVILTKGTKTLASQTLARAKADFAFARKTDVIDGRMKVMITDIMDLRHKGVSTIDTNDDLCRQIIICKKEKRNLESLIELYERISPNLRTERTLVVDDEADFASRVYRGSKQDTDLAKISEQIDHFRHLPKECRYLEVTATPYSLYLQPDGTILRPDGNKALPFRPHFTELVPVHDKYIGGKQYFEESQDESSMYSHLFVPVSDKCLEVLAKSNKRYLKSTYHSDNTNGMAKAICGYFMAGAIRSLQAERKGTRYSSSCLIHIQVNKSSHEWQSAFIGAMVEDIRETLMDKDGVDVVLDDFMLGAYEDYKESIGKGVAAGLMDAKDAIPDFGAVMAKIRTLMEHDYQVRIVNSDNDVHSLLDEKGQLSLDRSLNIFIGGSILDRGITVANMLCFFYGRNPKNFQMDTALQHARMYGARSKEDMAVTRFYTTYAIHAALATIHGIDSLLREQFTTRGANGDIEPSPVIIGNAPGIKACDKAKIKLSDTTVVRAHARLLPTGFQIGDKKTVAPIVAKIDSLIKSQPEFDAKREKFLLDGAVAGRVLGLIEKTYVYDEKYENKGMEWESNGMAAIIRRGLQSVDDRKVWCIWRDGRQMSRKLRSGAFSDSPDAGNVEGSLARRLATDRPVLTLLREDGDKAQGWSGTPFYWPVLFTPETFTPGIYAKDAQKEFDEDDDEPSGIEEIVKGIPSEDILTLPIERGFLEHIYLGAKKFEYRLLEPKNAGRYIEMSGKGGAPKLAKGVKASDLDAGLFSLNGGVFPFILKKFKYIVVSIPFAKGNGSRLLLRLADGPDWVSACATKVDDNFDTLRDKYGDVEEVEIDNEYCWTLRYRIAEVVAPRVKYLDDWKEQNPEEYEGLMRQADSAEE